MKKDEYKKLLQLAIEDYKNNNVSVLLLSKKYKISANTISFYLKKNGIEVKFCTNNQEEKWKLILKDLKLLSVEDVAKKYNVDKIILVLANEGLTIAEWKRRIIKLAVEEYKNINYYSKSISSISEKYGINKKTLRKYLEKEGIAIVNTGTKSNFKRDVFEVIDSEEKAYWLGFMYADGFITAKGHSVGLSLSLKDINHLKKFNSFLNYTHGLNIVESHQFGSKEKCNKNGEPMYMVSTVITDLQLWNSLNEKGCIPNKSLILTFPNENIFSNKHLIYDFIRGYVDGDGTLGVYPHSKKNPNLEESLSIIGTKSFLEGVLKYLGKGFLFHKPNCNSKTYRLGYSTTKAHNAADLLYKQASIYLDRKYDIYINKFTAIKSGKNGES